MTNGWHPQEDESRKQSTQATLKPEPQAERRDEEVSPGDKAVDRAEESPSADRE